MNPRKPGSHRLIDWSFLRWRWSPMEILMLIGIAVTLGMLGIMCWGTIKEFQESGSLVGGGTAGGGANGGAAGHATPSGE